MHLSIYSQRKLPEHSQYLALYAEFFGQLFFFMRNILQFVGIDTRGGAIDYWLRMYSVGIGLDDLRYPELIIETFGVQERVQRWIAYLILPIGLALFAFRCAQAGWQDNQR